MLLICTLQLLEAVSILLRREFIQYYLLRL
jgi:hypothetical protein